MMHTGMFPTLPHELSLKIIIVLVAALSLCGCASAPPDDTSGSEQPLATPQISPPSGGGKFYLDDGPPPEYSPEALAAIPDAVPRREKIHPGRNRPYTTQWGQHYRPYSQLKPHYERGHASWYGRRYHGRKTASGETYDMFKMTAAHPFLAIPSYVRVSRAGSDKSVVVRVNDRGPFLGGRIIDLSFAAANRLGIVDSGTAEVIVEAILPPEEPLATPPATDTASAVYLQLGAFALAENAENMRRRFVEEGLGLHAHKIAVREDKHVFLAGPYPNRAAAQNAAAVLCAKGWCDSWIHIP